MRKIMSMFKNIKIVIIFYIITVIFYSLNIAIAVHVLAIFLLGRYHMIGESEYSYWLNHIYPVESILWPIFLIMGTIFNILHRHSKIMKNADVSTVTLFSSFFMFYASVTSFVAAFSLLFMGIALLTRVASMKLAPALSYLVTFLTSFGMLVTSTLLCIILLDLVISHSDRRFFKKGKLIVNEGGVRAFVFTGNRYAGFGFGSLLRGYAFVFTPTGELDSIGRGILVHELGHARGRHTIAIALVFLLALSNAIIVKFLHGLTYYLSILFMPFFMALPFITMRVCEVHADLALHRMYGEESVNQLREVLRRFYGVGDPRKAPLGSRLTHPGKRDLVLRFGDALAPHAPWEFPLLAALFNAAIVDFYLLLRISSFLPLVGRFLTLILTLFYVGSFVGGLVLIYLLGLVFKPLVRYFLAGSLIEDGLTNASLLLSSIYLAASAASLLLASLWWTAAVAAFVIALIIIRHYVGKLKPSLFIVLSTMVIYLAVNLVLLLIMHVTVPIALHWFESLWHVR